MSSTYLSLKPSSQACLSTRVICVSESGLYIGPEDGREEGQKLLGNVGASVDGDMALVSFEE